jgi:hypothetical protein
LALGDPTGAQWQRPHPGSTPALRPAKPRTAFLTAQRDALSRYGDASDIVADLTRRGVKLDIGGSVARHWSAGP